MRKEKRTKRENYADCLLSLKKNIYFINIKKYKKALLWKH